jgi:hypothetical protein
MYTKDSNFLTVIKSIFPDAHTLGSISVKLLSRQKSIGVDLRNADFCGQILEEITLGTVDEFIKKSLHLHFECSYGKIIVTCNKCDDLHFHPLELLEMANKPGLIAFVMDFKKRFNASVNYPVKIKEKINPYAVKKSLL